MNQFAWRTLINRIVQLCTYFVKSIYCPQMIFKTRNHEKIVFKEMYVLKLAIKVAIQAALKEEAKNKDEESGVEDGSVFNR